MKRERVMVIHSLVWLVSQSTNKFKEHTLRVGTKHSSVDAVGPVLGDSWSQRSRAHELQGCRGWVGTVFHCAPVPSMRLGT